MGKNGKINAARSGVDHLAISSYLLPEQVSAPRAVKADSPAEPAATPTKAPDRFGRQLTPEQLLNQMSSLTMRSRYLLGVAKNGGEEGHRYIDGTLISAWLAKAWLDLAKRDVVSGSSADPSARRSDWIVRGWPNFLQPVDPNIRKSFFRKFFHNPKEAEEVAKSGRIMTEPNGFWKRSVNGRIIYKDLTGVQFASGNTDPEFEAYVDFLLPEEAGLLDLGTRTHGHHEAVHHMYLVPGPARIDRSEIERILAFRSYGRELPPDLKELAYVVDSLGSTPPEVYIPVTVLGWGAGGKVMKSRPSAAGSDAGDDISLAPASTTAPATEEPVTEAEIDPSETADAVIAGGLKAFPVSAMTVPG